MSSLFSHQDHLMQLSSQAPLSEKLKLLHDRLRTHFAFIDRMSRYARLIARDRAKESGFDDQRIEYVF